MAGTRDSRVGDALRDVATAVGYEGGGTWTLSISNGADVPARAQVSGGWLALRAAIPYRSLREHDDLTWLRVNAKLAGSARVARALGDPAPHLLVDSFIAGEPDVRERVQSACVDLSGALHVIEQWPGSPPSAPDIAPSQSRAAEIERACAEAGWRCVVDDGGRVRLDIETRGGAYAARLVSSSTGTDCAVVELTDLAGQSPKSQQAVAALLMAVSSSVRSVKGVLRDHGGAAAPALSSPFDGSCDRSIDRALSALAVACLVSGREVPALRDERLAASYLALWDAVSHNHSHMTEEEYVCL